MKAIELLGEGSNPKKRIVNGKEVDQAITPYKGSWADEEAKRKASGTRLKTGDKEWDAMSDEERALARRKDKAGVLIKGLTYPVKESTVYRGYKIRRINDRGLSGYKVAGLEGNDVAPNMLTAKKWVDAAEQQKMFRKRNESVSDDQKGDDLNAPEFLKKAKEGDKAKKKGFSFFKKKVTAEALVARALGEDCGECDDEDEEKVECPACSGDGEKLGGLGNLNHYRCRDCGTTFNRRAEKVKENKYADHPTGSVKKIRHGDATYVRTTPISLKSSSEKHLQFLSLKSSKRASTISTPKTVKQFRPHFTGTQSSAEILTSLKKRQA